jgi:hypothetical protein
MLTIQSQLHVADITGTEMMNFLLHCTDREYQAWWKGTHLEFHTIKRYPNDVGNLVYMDEFVGKRRVRMMAIVTEVAPGQRIVWQMKKIIRLPVWFSLELKDDGAGVMLTHTIRAGFGGVGRILDPIFRLYFSNEFSRAMDEHAQIEFPKLRDLLHAQVQVAPSSP